MKDNKRRLSRSDISVMKRIVSVVIDSRDFFERAKASLGQSELSQLFDELSQDRDRSRRSLTRILSKYGVKAPSSGTMSGELRKLYLDFLGLLDDEPSQLATQILMHEARNIEVLENERERANYFVVQIIDDIINTSRQSMYLIQKQVEDEAAVATTV